MNNKDRIARFRSKIERGELIVGCNVSSPDSSISEALALSGLDIVWVDTEHSSLGKPEVLDHIRSIQGAQCVALVRVPNYYSEILKPIADMGPDGIIFPMISTADEARLAVESLVYPPEGVRGFGPIRANNYGNDENYLTEYRDKLLCFIQIETSEGLRNIADICTVPGVDGVLIGGMDLSASIDILGKTNTMVFKNAVNTIFSVAKEKGKYVGCCAPLSMEIKEMYCEAGAQIYLAGGDYALITKGARELISKLKTV